MQMNLNSLFKPIPRAAGVSRRTIFLGLGGRFTDEILGGVPNVLMPTLRGIFGLTYTQISLLPLATSYVALIVEPVAGLLIDLLQRRLLLAAGALLIGLATAVIGIAPTFLLLLLGFAIYGVGSGPLAHTADVVLVESHPDAPSRIYTRATAVDTVGALLAPLLVSLTFWLELSWRSLLVALAAGSFVYALFLWRTDFPNPPGRRDEDLSLRQELAHNVRAVLQRRETASWILFLFVFEVLEAPLTFKTVWLNEQAGMSQPMVGLYVAAEMAASLLSLLYLDHWLERTPARKILQLANGGLLLLYPLWLLLPGMVTRFMLGIPVSFLFAVYWPIARARALASAAGRAGALSALLSTFSLVPIRLVVGILAGATSLTATMLWIHIGATLGLAAILWRMPHE